MIYKRVAARLRAQDWLAITIELTIVIVGVFIGTQVSNWNQARIERRETRAMLVGLKPGLKGFVDFFVTARDYYGTTTRYGEVALAGWSGDKRVRDSDFVIAAYQASQIYVLGINAVNWTRVFGGERMDGIDDPALHNHLANLMTLNFDQIDIVAIDTPYRQHVRQQIPDDIQNAIRAQCGDRPIPEKPLTQALPRTCALDLPDDRWAEAARTLRAHPELAGELRWHRAATAAFLNNMSLVEQQTRLVLGRIHELGL